MGTLRGRSKEYRAIASAVMLSVTLALVAGCGDSNSVSETSPGTVVGQVVSFATSAPVSGATVKTGTGTATTAADGKFSISAPAGNRTLVRVEATGFAEAFPVVRVTSGQTANLGVKLVPIAATDTVSVAAGGTVLVSRSTARVVIPANGLVPEPGGTPAGTVSVLLTLINPATDPNLMPGGFTGLTAGGGSETPIESFGVLGVDIRDAAGTRYTLAGADGNHPNSPGNFILHPPRHDTPLVFQRHDWGMARRRHGDSPRNRGGSILRRDGSPFHPILECGSSAGEHRRERLCAGCQRSTGIQCSRANGGGRLYRGRARYHRGRWDILGGHAQEQSSQSPCC